VARVSQEVGGALYAQQAEAAGAAGAGEAPGEGAGAPSGGDDDVVDAEIVDDEGTEKR
jgi:molecular chaperone DnaK